ncbi:MAG TPA: Uma2 family endonuclease [Candidatus Acidoferrales bacterium]|jgi:Uma2 family endonuclease|nr:Uma2 family endonuclease [Candidatus Acidoferrales bacterium]
MGIGLVTLEEYLNTSYSPDREYVDGAVVERNVGDRPHSMVQSNVIFSLRQRYGNLFVWPAQRIRTIADRRSRVPDVCFTLQDPGTDVFDTPPLIAIEILSKRDEMSDVLEKLDEYVAFGIAHIWVIDPRRKKAFTFEGGRLQEVAGGALTAAHPAMAAGIQLPLAEAFRGL